MECCVEVWDTHSKKKSWKTGVCVPKVIEIKREMLKNRGKLWYESWSQTSSNYEKSPATGAVNHGNPITEKKIKGGFSACCSSRKKDNS